MAILHKSKQLKKELTLINVYAIATGTTLSAGFFLLPGLAYAQAGPALILCYIIAAIPLIPAMFCMMELATAMPRAGGTYYFLDRSMGPLVGTIGGFGTWFSLILKSAFALIGMGAYLNLFIPGNYLIPFALGFAIFFGIINLVGTKETGSIQVFLVGGILILLAWFVGKGIFHVNPDHFSNFLGAGGDSILGTAGMVYISYVGVTNIASISEEVKNPERNLPLGMFLAFGTALVIYILGTYVMVGVLPEEKLSGSLTPVAATADYMVGHWGKVLVTIAAVFAFASVTNAGILSASRYPLSMSRDHILPKQFRQLNSKGIPKNSIILTVGIIILFLLAFDAVKIAKLASSFQLFMFALCCLAVIIMRESHIEAYDPGFRSPFYPWLHIFGIITPFLLIWEMGATSILFSFGLVAVGLLWYIFYARIRVKRGGAIYHVFERLGKRRYEGLEPELRGILKEKGLRAEDPFDELVTRAQFIDLDKEERFDEIIKKASQVLAQEISYPAEKIEEEIMQGTKVGATPVAHGAALPHMRLHHLIEPELLLIRSKVGVRVDMGKDFWGEHAPGGPLHAIFFLISPEENPGQHLRILAKIASHIDEEDFIEQWLAAPNEQNLKEFLLRDERFMSLRLKTDTPSSKLIGKELRALNMPKETLIAMIRREGKALVPRGSTVLEAGDRLTIIGDKKGIEEFRNQYGSKP